MTGQEIIVFIILLICISSAGYKLFRFFKTDKTEPDKKCDNCECKKYCHRKPGRS